MEENDQLYTPAALPPKKRRQYSLDRKLSAASEMISNWLCMESNSGLYVRAVHK
jgi:hypothetical protein